MIAITGAAGFIGSNLAHRLTETEPLTAPLILVDHPLNAERARNLEDFEAIRFFDHEAFLDALRKDSIEVAAIFHLGACSDTTEANWEFLQRNNLEYSQKLWDACVQRKIPFIYASSAATYGDGSRGFDDQTPPHQLEPLNLYGKSKNDFDIWVLERVARGEPTPQGWSGLKFFNVYGPREAHKGRMASMVWHSYQQIHITGCVRLFKSTDPAFADGGQLRDFVYVDDNLDHMIWLWKNPNVRGIFNSGTGAARSFTDLVSATFRALDREPRIEFIEMPGDLQGRYQNYTRAEMTKLRQAGYPGLSTSLEEGVARYVGWLQKQDQRLSRAAG